MLFIRQLLIEMLGMFFEPTWLLHGVSRFLHSEFSLFQGKQSKHPRSFNWHSFFNCTYILEEFSTFVFDACYTYINVCVKFDDFFLIMTERKSLPMCQFFKKIGLESTQYVFLDHSKALVFIDVIKIEIIFKYLCAWALVPIPYAPRKLYKSFWRWDFQKCT